MVSESVKHRNKESEHQSYTTTPNLCPELKKVWKAVIWSGVLVRGVMPRDVQVGLGLVLNCDLNRNM